jgi:hypothetical protein
MDVVDKRDGGKRELSAVYVFSYGLCMLIRNKVWYMWNLAE